MKDEDYDEEDYSDNIYNEEDRQEQLDEDEIDELQEGFMQGYEKGERLAKCALCKKVLSDRFIEEEIDGEIYHFCSEDHADLFTKQKEKE